MLKNQSDKTQKQFFREWLEKLQQESWQLELLISGLAIFGIWESKSLLDNFKDYLDLNSSGLLTTYFRQFFLFLSISWSIFFFNLLAHIVLRGLWIGAIGLRYVSGEIDYESLNYSERFDKFLRKNVGDFDNYIQKLEKISSVLFSFSFLLLFLFMSIMALLIVIAGLFQIITTVFDKEEGQMYIFGIVLFVFLALLVFIDFITFGAFKRIREPSISRLYFWLYRFFGIITLSFLYRPLLYNFIDDKYTKRLVLIALPYIFLVSILMPTLGFNAYNYVPSFSTNMVYDEYIAKSSFHYLYYDDLREEYSRTKYAADRNPIIQKASLGKQEYENETLAKIFFKSRKDDEEYLKEKYPDLQAFTKKGFYSIFSSSDLKNEIIASLKSEEAVEIGFMRRVLRGMEDRIDSSVMEKFSSSLQRYRNHTAEDYERLRDSINKLYVQQRFRYYDEYLNEMLNANMDMNQMSIDSVNYTDSLECSYFVHPNMGEKGILCYFPLSSLNSGKHTIEVTRKNQENGEDNYFIPFIINRKTKEYE